MKGALLNDVTHDIWPTTEVNLVIAVSVLSKV